MAVFKTIAGMFESKEVLALREELATLRSELEGLRAGRSLGSYLMEGARTFGTLINDNMPACISNRTTMEKVLLPLVGGYFIWQAHRHGVIKYAIDHSGSVIPGVDGFKRVFQRKPRVVCDDSQKSPVGKALMESIRANSKESKMTMPDCQCSIGFMCGSEFRVVGHAVRFDGNILVGPDHVLSDDDTMDKMAFGRQGMISLRGKERVLLDTDLVMIKLTEKDMSQIGIKIAVIANLPIQGNFVSVVGPGSKGTIGAMNHDKTCFGRVIYDGTTMGGYSGAAYSMGASVVGIHQLGGVINSGFAARYVWMLAKYYLDKSVEESSDDWLRSKYDSGAEISWKHHPDPNYIEVFDGSNYSTVLKRSMDEAFGEVWENNPRISRARRRTYDDSFESASGEQMDSSTSGASSSSEKAQELLQQNVLDVIKQYTSLSKTQQKSFRKSIMPIKGVMNSTNGQAN